MVLCVSTLNETDLEWYDFTSGLYYTFEHMQGNGIYNFIKNREILKQHSIKLSKTKIYLKMT